MPEKIVLLTRDQIMAAQDIKTEVVDVPAWGGSVMVRSMTGKQRDAFEESLQVKSKGKTTVSLQQFRAKLVSWTVVDADGKRVFTESDVAWLGEKSASSLTRVAEVASRLSGISDIDAEEMIKNSEADQGESSG